LLKKWQINKGKKMGVVIWFEKNGISEKETKEIQKAYINKFLYKEYKKEGKTSFIDLNYPFCINIKSSDFEDLGLSLQFSTSLMFFPNIRIGKIVEKNRKVSYVEDNKKIEYNIFNGYGGTKNYYLNFKKDVEDCIKKTKEYYSNKSKEEQIKDKYEKQLIILEGFLEFAKTGIEHPNLIIHPD
jgi:hypothetical protein